MTGPMVQGAALLVAAAVTAGGVVALATETPGVAARAAKGADGPVATAGAVPGAAGRGGPGASGQRASGVERGRGTPSPEGLGASAAAGQAPPHDGAVRPRWRWPLSPRPAVVRPFLAPLSRFGRGHRGIDLAAEAGAPVLAVDAGRIRHAGPVAGRGTVTVQHRDGLLSTYEPLTPRVRAGDVVEAGDVLGTTSQVAGSAHCGARTCLHLGARRVGTYLDPLPLLSAGRLALLPLARPH